MFSREAAGGLPGRRETRTQTRKPIFRGSTHVQFLRCPDVDFQGPRWPFGSWMKPNEWQNLKFNWCEVACVRGACPR